MSSSEQESISATEREQQLEDLFGPMPTYSEHKKGETITFREAGTGQTRQGTILWVKAPGPSYKGGPMRPLTYIVYTGQGMPSAVYPGDVIEKT